jgi:hypothetical protein
VFSGAEKTQKNVSAGQTQVTFSNLFAGRYEAVVVAHKKDTRQTKLTSVVHLETKTVGASLSFADTVEVSLGRQTAIAWLASRGITSGSPAGSNTFKPWDSVNRGAMAQFMRRVVSNPKQTKKSPNFKDLGTGILGRDDDIKWLASEGITTGSPAGSNTYKPSNVVSRGAMAEFLYKLAGSPGAINPNSSDKKNHHVKPSEVADQEGRFKADSDLQALKSTNPNRYYDILWLAKNNITVGSVGPDGLLRYNPSAPVNRGAMAEFLKRLYELL